MRKLSPTLLFILCVFCLLGCKLVPLDKNMPTEKVPKPKPQIQPDTTAVLRQKVEQPAHIVATTIPVLEAICKELIDSTNILIINPLGPNTTLDEFENFFDEKESLLDSLALIVDAVVDIRSIIPEDMLYIELRERNIKTVHIECATPQSSVLGAIGNIREQDGSINPYIWLAPTNMIRMAEIAGSDLMALYPKASTQIKKNLATFRKEIISVKIEYDNLFLELPRFDAAQMDESFSYLVKDLDLFIVQKYPPEIDWTDSITTQYRQSVEESQFATVVHRWEPFGAPKDIADSAKITFAILNPGLPKGKHFENGVASFVKVNLEALYQALKSSSLNQ